jgi:hypothetical protein
MGRNPNTQASLEGSREGYRAARAEDTIIGERTGLRGLVRSAVLGDAGRAIEGGGPRHGAYRAPAVWADVGFNREKPRDTAG